MQRWGSQRRLDHYSDAAVFSRSSGAEDDDDDDEAALTWAALERLPTYDRLRKGFLHNGGLRAGEMVEVGKLGFAQKREFVDKILNVVEDDNEQFLLKLRTRMNK